MIELTPDEWAAVDTPIFQRLRRVRQLAMTHLVYPGTLHTRFGHSIGVRHITRRLGESLGIDSEEQRVVQAAALLHDVGHAQSQLGFDADGLWAVEEMRMARHHMHRQVYGHKTRLATDIMTTRALSLAIADGVLSETGFKVPVVNGRPEVGEEFLAEYLEQTDERVLEALCTAWSGRARSSQREPVPT